MRDRRFGFTRFLFESEEWLEPRWVWNDQLTAFVFGFQDFKKPGWFDSKSIADPDKLDGGNLHFPILYDREVGSVDSATS